MDLVSQLYGMNFCARIGDWCRKHHVEYIGHVIEDNGSHARLGLGTGHFFRALWGQDMAGIDVVLQQIRPQLDDCQFYHVGGNGFYDGTFFHYGLAKLGVSLGHLDPKKKGRTMCEVFGAYGWAEGVKQMKWLLDHMLVNGVNWFVPHAFTMKEFPDPDCPPHFYARGNNPQFPYFRNLMEYCNRVSHLIQEGTHVPCVALLYTAEQEWMGTYRPFEQDAKELTRGQIDFEIVPAELLAFTKCQNGKMLIGKEQADALIVSQSSYLAKETAEQLKRLANEGLPVLFTGSKPEALDADGVLYPLAEEKWAGCVKEGELVKTLHQRTIWDLQTEKEEPWLRYYHYVHEDGELYLFFQESVTEPVSTTIRFAEKKTQPLWWYDPWTNRLAPCGESGQDSITLSLSPYEMKILYVGEVEDAWKTNAVCGEWEEGEAIDLSSGPWTLQKKEAGTEQFTEETLLDALKNLTGRGAEPRFSGTMRYRVSFDGTAKKGAWLDLGEVYETAEVRVNGKMAGVRIAPPYRFSLDGLLQNGKNELEITVTNTLVHSQRDYFSMTMPMEPSGLLGPVTIVNPAE
jgi:hypothetical protein